MHLSCTEIQRLIPWLLDDELDPDQSLELESHINTCVSCRVELEREGNLRIVLRRAAASISVPLSLQKRMDDVFENERRYEGVVPWLKMWPAVAAAAVLLTFIWRSGNGAGAEEWNEVARRHVGNLPMDVVGADVASVQNYFSEKLPFAVRLPRLAATPASTLGGRIIQLNQRDAAYVRYDTPRGRVSLVVYEDDNSNNPQERVPTYQVGPHRVMIDHVHGYITARWRAAGLVYSVVTDLPEQEFSGVLTRSMP